MSDLVKSEPNSGKVTNPSGRGTRGRGKQKDEKTINDRAPITIEVEPIDPDTVDAVADKTLADAAMDVADAELTTAINAYDTRSNQNLGILSEFIKKKQSTVANAISRHAFETFGVTEKELYGDSSDA